MAIDPYRLQKAVEAAQDSFWERVAQKYPEATDGFFPPEALVMFEAACAKAVETWVSCNVKGALDGAGEFGA